MPISAAAHKGDTSIMELLISKGAHVDALNFSGSTALIQVLSPTKSFHLISI